MRRIVIGAILLGACNGSKLAAPEHPAQPVARTLAANIFDTLQHLPVTDGRLVCLADGQAPCPTTPATANWLYDGKYATWEQHRPVEIWTPGKTDPRFLGETGGGKNQYDVVLSAAETHTGFTILSLTNSAALMYDTQGRFVSSLPMPQVTVSRTRGFAGDVPFVQIIRETGPDSAAVFEVREVDGPGDTVGRTVLNTTLSWFRLRDGKTTIPVPLIPTLPSYAIAADSDIVWCAGDLIDVERRSPTGALRWSLTTAATGPAITPADLKFFRGKIPVGDKAKLAGFDSSAARTGKYYPAVSGLFVSPGGKVLLQGSQVPMRDSVDYFVLANDGAPVGRFAMPRRTRPLLFAGDSLLVQRAGANANQELRWLVVKPH